MTLKEAADLVRQQRKEGNIEIKSDGGIKLTPKGMREALAKWRKRNKQK